MTNSLNWSTENNEFEKILLVNLFRAMLGECSGELGCRYIQETTVS
jgi:hypothetical protein